MTQTRVLYLLNSIGVKKINITTSDVNPEGNSGFHVNRDDQKRAKIKKPKSLGLPVNCKKSLDQIKPKNIPWCNRCIVTSLDVLTGYS